MFFTIKFIHYLVSITMTVLALALPLPTWAASSDVTSSSNLTSEQLTSEQLERLVGTLENESQREAFIENLKTLIAAKNQPQQEGFLISDFLNLDKTSSSFIDRYIQSLNELGISDSQLGNLFILVVSAVGLVAAALLNQYLARKLSQKLEPLRNKLHLSGNRFTVQFRILSIFGFILAASLFAYTTVTLFTNWLKGLADYINLSDIIQTEFTFLVILILATSIWDVSNALIEYIFNRKSHWSRARAQTLEPVVRNVVMVTLTVFFLLVGLSELGIDIYPLLAGAGVAGIAIGFGAQALVKDFLTGFIVVFEDLLQVGDVINVAGRTGAVERITMRKIQLRSLDGTVHTVPFSEVAVVDNLTKEFSYYLLDVGVAYREDIDEVIQCLRQIDEDMRATEKFGEKIIAELEVLGVDKFADSAVIVRARTKTRAHDKWSVGREFNRRIKQEFDRRNIEIPFPHQTIYFGEDKQGSAPAAKLELSKNSPNND